MILRCIVTTAVSWLLLPGLRMGALFKSILLPSGVRGQWVLLRRAARWTYDINVSQHGNRGVPCRVFSHIISCVVSGIPCLYLLSLFTYWLCYRWFLSYLRPSLRKTCSEKILAMALLAEFGVSACEQVVTACNPLVMGNPAVDKHYQYCTCLKFIPIGRG